MLNSKLTNREMDVLRLISAGYSTIDMSNELHLGFETIRTYRKRLMRKLDASNSASLVMKGFCSGILTTDNLFIQ